MIKQPIIIWDFDGVIMDSNAVRNNGFEEVLKEYPKEEVSKLMDFHERNGGLSRYVKFRYFFEEVRNETITDEQVLFWANKFSDIMLAQLGDKKLLIQETYQYIKENSLNKKMHIVSASDQTELRLICEKVGIDKLFKSIHGSPTTKILNVKLLLESEKYESNDVVLIGDSINDYQAAIKNNISFCGYNNLRLEKLGNYISKFY
jgi:phosphoglycolate phosphatase-like HAD superfamily hydrolase